MYRSTMIRTFVSARTHPSMRTLAPPRLLLGQRWTTPSRQPQQFRALSLLDAVPYLGRRRVNKRLKAELDQAASIKDPGQKRRVLFDVVRRLAANNGGSDRLEFKSPEGSMSLKSLAEAAKGNQPDHQRLTACQCSVDTVGRQNMRYAIDTTRPARWKVWAAVDAELGPPPGSGRRTISAQEAVDACLVVAVVVIVRHECEEFQKQLAADIKEATLDGGPGGLPEKIDLELLVWDTVIPLEVDTRELNQSTHWVGKLGERRPWKDVWFPIISPIPFFFDF